MIGDDPGPVVLYVDVPKEYGGTIWRVPERDGRFNLEINGVLLFDLDRPQAEMMLQMQLADREWRTERGVRLISIYDPHPSPSCPRCAGHLALRVDCPTCGHPWRASGEKHGPMGQGGRGPCEPDCEKCRREKEAAG